MQNFKTDLEINWDNHSRPRFPPFFLKCADKCTQNLRKRIATHFRGNAEGSTLRRSLGTLLAEESGFSLRRVGSGKRITLTHHVEQWLENWMQENAFVCWVPSPEPWEAEGEILKTISCPLNIQGNSHSEFSKQLKNLRVDAIGKARLSEIAVETGNRSGNS
jgi:hypothetical protein